MTGVPGSAAPVVGQGHVDALGDEHLLVALVLKLLLALLERLPDPRGGGAHPAPGVGAGLRRQGADLGAREGERRLVPGVRQPRLLELVQGARGGYRRERGLRRALNLVGGQGGHLYRIVVLVRCGHFGSSARWLTATGPPVGREGPQLCRSSGTRPLSRTDAGFTVTSTLNPKGWPATASPGPDGEWVGGKWKPAGTSGGRPWGDSSRDYAMGMPAGTVNRNSAPPPGAWVTVMSPSIASTRPFTMYRPRPVPPRRLPRQN